MEVIADRLDIQLRYMPNKCGIFKFGLSKVIILDSLLKTRSSTVKTSAMS